MQQNLLNEEINRSPGSQNSRQSQQPVPVLLVIGGLAHGGGSERQFVNLAKHIDRTQFSPTVVVLSDYLDLAGELYQADIPVQIIRKRGRFDLTASWRLAKLIRKLRPKIVHSYLDSANGLLAITALVAPIPIFLPSMRSAPPQMAKMWRLLYKTLSFKIRAFTVNASATIDLLKRELNFPAERIFLIRNGVDTSHLETPVDLVSLRQTLDIPPHHFIIGVVARVNYIKNHELLLNAVAEVKEQVPNIRVLIAGGTFGEKDEAYQAELLTLRDRLGLQKIVMFLGNRQDVPALLQLFDLVVLCSKWEAFSNALLEAMASGKPIIVTKTADQDGVIEEAGCGVTIEPDKTKMAETILSIINKSNDERQQLGKRGQAWVANNHSLDIFAAENQRVWHKLLAEIET